MNKTILPLFLGLFLLSACGLVQPTGYNRQAQPADPNQALLQILQQKTLERTINDWRPQEYMEPFLKQIQLQQVQINKIIKVMETKEKPKEKFEYDVPPVHTLPDYPSIKFEYGEVENNS